MYIIERPAALINNVFSTSRSSILERTISEDL